MDRAQLASWESKCLARVTITNATDPAHDLAHVIRVANLAARIAVVEQGRLDVVLPAAWLHDLVKLPKDDPRRAQASRLSADSAITFLRDSDFPSELLPDIAHCIEAHSFSARIQAKTLEACIVQDADRLDALGAIGIARCFAVSGALGRSFYQHSDPFATHRPLDDSQYALDHFPVKLFKIAEALKTNSGRAIGRRRIDFMRSFIDQFRTEIDPYQHESAFNSSQS